MNNRRKIKGGGGTYKSNNISIAKLRTYQIESLRI